MTDATVVAVDPPTEPPPDTGGFDSVLHIPPFDAAFFSENNFNGDSAAVENQNDDVCVLDNLDFDFSFDDLGLPPSGGLDNLLNPTQLQQSDCEPRSGSDFAHFAPDFCQLDGVFKSTAADLCHLSGDGEFLGDQSWDGSGLLNSSSPEAESHQISSYLNMQSPESNGSNRGSTENCVADGKGLSCHSPESQGSGNFESNVSEDSTNNCAVRSVSSSPNSSNSSVKTGVVDQKIKLEESANINSNISVLKRKKEGEDLVNNSTESRNNKFRKSNCNSENNNNRDGDVGLDEEEEKKKARLLRNRESAQLSRQRKKHYVEELEDKVRNMHSTIQDLNAKITYFMAENATLKQQMGGGGPGGGGGTAAVPPPMAPPPPGMYTHPAMMYPWMPYAPPYMMKSQGSQVPLVPIPRLKPQQQAQAPKSNKKVESKKNEGPKTKKVAGVSFLGLLFFMMLFGCLVPMVNVRYGGTREVFTGGEGYIRGGFNQYHHGRVLMVNGTNYDEKHGGTRDFSSNSGGQRSHGGGGEPPSIDEFVHSGNGSEPLAASLYVPRNDKLVKIDGNLIIHSVLASEKAMACQGKGCGETGLVVSGDLAPAIPGSVVGRNGAGHTLLRALGSGSVDKDGTKSTASDGKLQQWFREGLAGPMLSAGMCTEVFQFDVSAAIVPATSSRNITEEQSKNSTHPSKAKTRRILHPIPFPESSHNISGENAGRKSEKEGFNINNKTSSMVVSVLFDPREAGDADVDGVMGTKSFSRIFVVVLMDSVKYVTYSCMLPFKGSTPHLVTT